MLCTLSGTRAGLTYAEGCVPHVARPGTEALDRPSHAAPPYSGARLRGPTSR